MSNLIFSQYINKGNNILIENIKIMIYKENPSIFNLLEFENDLIYKEPLLFVYFSKRNKVKISLESILYGYIKKELRPKIINLRTDKIGRIYLPHFGWLITNKFEQDLQLITEDKLSLLCEGKKCNFTIEPLEFIKGTNIELLKYPTPYLEPWFYDVDKNLIDVEIEKISALHVKHINKSFEIIKKLVPQHCELIDLVTSKFLIFNVDSTLRNSFASRTAHGIAFFNAYQKNYNEVFFVDDIAHQTGHVLFNTILNNVNDFIKVDPSTIIQTLELDGKTVETRHIYMLFHALFTYYTTFICLNACLDKSFKKEKKHEAMGRMYFYLGKCCQDIELIDSPFKNSNGPEKFFTKKGLEIYYIIKNQFKLMADKWVPVLKNTDLSNQPYNFSYSKFVQLNKFHD